MGRYHWLAYYQRRIALYTASKFNTKFSQFDIDGDFDTLFKECWCKVFPTDTENALLMVARQQPSLSLKGGKLKEQDMGSKKNKAALLVAADSIGKKIQYDCPGFLSNRRKYRMAGLAAIEIAQMVSKEWYSLHRRKIRIDFSQNRGGAACTSTSRVLMSWQEIYSSAVRWMQISDPFNKVLWLNKLREDFNSEFFCHMPIVLEQTKSVRYFPHYERILNVTKLIMREKLYVHNKGYEAIDLSKEGKSKDIEYAKTFDELCEHVGEEFFATTWCSSTAVDGRQLQGSTINIFKSRQQRGYDVFIKTSCPSSRCQDFDIEMNAAWAAICNSYCGDNFGSTDFKALQSLTEAIVRMTYYWYNYKPLSCDAEVVGFVVLLGLLLAANMNFAGNVPKGVQVDLEAILNFDPDYFVDSVESWLYPSINISSSWRDLPDVASTFSTTGCSPQ